MPNRTYFRKVDKAVADFAFELKKMGYGEHELYNTFKNELWVLEVFDGYARKSTKAIENLNLLQLALRSLRKSVYAAC